MIILKHYPNDALANMAKAILDENKIRCLIVNTESAAVEGAAHAFGGSQIAVDKADVSRANDLLNSSSLS